MTAADEMLAHAAAHTARLAVGALDSRPRRRVAVLTCMDARIDPAALLGIARGDAHVLRNAGALVTDDALRSLAASQRMLGTEEVVIVMHDRCGLRGADDARFAQQLAADGATPAWRLGGFADVEAELRAGLARVRAAPELPHRARVRGFVFEPADGTLREVRAAHEED